MLKLRESNRSGGHGFRCQCGRHGVYSCSLFIFHLGFVRPLQNEAPHQCLPLSSNAFLFQVVPSFLAVSSCHFRLGRPLDFFSLLGCSLRHLLSFILAI